MRDFYSPLFVSLNIQKLFFRILIDDGFAAESNSVSSKIDRSQQTEFKQVARIVLSPAGSLKALNRQRFKAFFVLQLNKQ